MRLYYEMIINLAVTAILSTVKNPKSMAKLKPVLFQIAAVIYAAAVQLGDKELEVLDEMIDDQIAENVEQRAR